MKKSSYIVVLIFVLCFCIGCSNQEEKEQKNTEEVGKQTFQTLKQEIDIELEEAKEGKYSNLKVTCADIRLPENESIQSISFPVYTFTKKMNLEGKINFYKDVILPKLYDGETIDSNQIIDVNSRDHQKEEEYYAYDYHYMLEHLEELEETARVGYYNKENYQFMETAPEGVCINISQGVIGALDNDSSPFATIGFEEVKTYNCYLDDLSDSYLVIDGQKTVAEAKEEIETYLNNLYPLVGEKNGIENEVYEIIVMKIPNTEYHVFNAVRTLSYNGIRVKEECDTRLESEVGVMGQAILCESNKVDITLGFVNCFEQGSVIKDYKEILPFSEVMERLSYYLTGDTTFNIGYIGLEYRMFTEVVDEVTYYNWIPYWSFLAENPNDDSVIRIYMDMETGDMQSYGVS
ncbi:MAG: hypothetical protein IKJ01_08450 [Lachnospiraceae bacterium]|nr:hypothetical protein [Lachnospiraceae bacterium]